MTGAAATGPMLCWIWLGLAVSCCSSQESTRMIPEDVKFEGASPAPKLPKLALLD